MAKATKKKPAKRTPTAQPKTGAKATELSEADLESVAAGLAMVKRVRGRSPRLRRS